MNGLRYKIQDELTMMSVRTVEDAYQFALKAKEKLARKQSQRGRGKISTPNKDKGVSHDKAHNSKDEAETPESTRSLKKRKFPRKTGWWKKLF
jgi:hypothetical protein